MGKRRHRPAADQLALPFDEPLATLSPVVPVEQQVIVPIEPSFDVSQGIREVRIGWNGKDDLHVQFDGRFLILAEQNIPGTPEAGEAYLSRHGSVINLAALVNVLRCFDALTEWYTRQIGHPCRVSLIPPETGTRVRALWDILGMEHVLQSMVSAQARRELPRTPQTFGSRYVSPLLFITTHNKAAQIGACQTWIEAIADRLGSRLQTHLLMAIPEIMTNLVKFGFAGGAFVLSVWPSGQVEILWMNRVDHLPQWPDVATATGLAQAFDVPGRGGAGMDYLLNTLLPTYYGVLRVNHRGNDVAFRSGNYAEVYGANIRSDVFLPPSILFALELFATEVRDRSDPS